VSRTGGLTDIVASPEVGRTFPPRNPERLATVLSELAGNAPLRKQVGKQGRKYALHQFSWSKLAARAADLYSVLQKEGKEA